MRARDHTAGRVVNVQMPTNPRMHNIRAGSPLCFSRLTRTLEPVLPAQFTTRVRGVVPASFLMP